MNGYDAWRTQGPPESKTLRVTMTVTVDVLVHGDENMHHEASGLIGDVEKALSSGLPPDVEGVEVKLVEREVLR